MKLLIAIFIPWLSFFLIKRPIAAVICLILQITLIGWVPAAIWAAFALSSYNTEKRIEQALNNR